MVDGASKISYRLILRRHAGLEVARVGEDRGSRVFWSSRVQVGACDPSSLWLKGFILMFRQGAARSDETA